MAVSLQGAFRHSSAQLSTILLRSDFTGFSRGPVIVRLASGIVLASFDTHHTLPAAMAPSPPSVAIPRTTAADFAARSFDYLVVGGGTAGLVVAARLSEDPSLTVGVIEAGSVGIGDPAIEVPGLYGSTLGTKYDWQFETVPQPGLAGRSLPWPRGKVLGGTSALNFMTWNRPSRDDFDAWERLGNNGWGWDGLLSVVTFFHCFFSDASLHVVLIGSCSWIVRGSSPRSTLLSPCILNCRPGFPLVPGTLTHVPESGGGTRRFPSHAVPPRTAVPFLQHAEHAAIIGHTPPA